MGRPAAEIVGKDDAAFCSPDNARNIRERDLGILRIRALVHARGPRTSSPECRGRS